MGVDVWHAGGDAAGYTFPDDDLWYRGKITTDKNGRYAYSTTYPATYSGRPIPHIHYKVDTGDREFVTQLYFENDVPRSYEDYVRGRESQFPQRTIQTRNERKFQFDIV